MLIIIDVKKDWNQEKWWNTMLYENVLIKIKCAKLKFSRKMMKYNVYENVLIEIKCTIFKFSRKMMKYNVIWKCSYKN